MNINEPAFQRAEAAHLAPPDAPECDTCWGTGLLCTLCGAPDNEEGHCNLDGWEWVECHDCSDYDEDYMKDPDRARDERIDREMDEYD